MTPTTLTTTFKNMFKLTKFAKQSSKSFDRFKKNDLFASKESTNDYLRRLSKEGFYGLIDFGKIKLKYQYSENDAKFDDADLLDNGMILVRESIEGTALSEVYDIGQRGEFRGRDFVTYSTDVYAGGGDDLIIGSHQGQGSTTQVINAYGGSGIDHYVSIQRRGTIINIRDMEAGETFTTNQSYNQLELAREFRDGSKQYYISSEDSNASHGIRVEPGRELIHSFDANGNNQFICIPEF